MKKIKQTISTVLPRVKLFLDDLEEIDKILKESCSSYNITFNEKESKSNSINDVIQEIDKILELYSSYTIILDEYELESIDEIKEIEEKRDFYHLEIRLTKPFFVLEIDGFETHIHTREDSLCIGITERIKPIIQKRKPFQLFYIFIYLLDFFKNYNSQFIVFTTKKSNEQSNYFIENKGELITKFFFGIMTTGIGIFIGNKVIPWFTSLLNGQ